MSRLREISLFDCDVRVLRNGFCKIDTLSWTLFTTVLTSLVPRAIGFFA